MNNKINTTLIYVTIIIIYINLAKTEDYDEKSAPNEDSSSLDSESNEVYNISIKEKPIREKNTVVKSKGNAQATIEISPRKNNNSHSNFNKHPNSTLIRDNRKCKRMGLSDYPYSVSIQKKGSHYSSGALVHKKWILTVASEFYNIRETIKLFRARLGSVNCKKGGDLVPLKGIEIHPSYVYKKLGFDLAMLRIGNRLRCSDNIRPISLSVVTGLIDNAKFLATYWPRLIVSGKILSQSAKERMKQYSMRVSTQKMIPWDKCYNVIQTYNQTLEVSSLCLEPIVSHHSPCMSIKYDVSNSQNIRFLDSLAGRPFIKPDVGAPIIADDGLWGITSGWVPYDCLMYEYRSPTIVTRISIEPIISWLNTLLDEEKK